MKSIWSESCTLPKKPTMKNDLVVEVAVIGGGMAGLLTAYLLKQQGLDVVVLEGAETASGATKNTTAKITSQHSLIYDRLIHSIGEEQAKQYANANQQAIERYRSIITENQIDCDFETKQAFVYSLDEADAIRAEADAAKSLGIDAKFTTKTDLPFPVQAAVEFSNQAQFNPLKFLNYLSSDLKIYEHTLALLVRDDTIITNRGRITADHIVIATHFPFINVPGWYFTRMHQQRSYVIALKSAAQLNGMYIDADENGYSFRNYGEYLLLGGGGHRTGKHPEEGSYEKLRGAAKSFFPGSEEAAHWSAQDCMTLDGIPYIGLFSAARPSLYVATGFNKWGMTAAMTAAMILTDSICGRENKNAEVFSPQRFHVSASAKNLLLDGAQSVAGLTAGVFSAPERKCTHLGCRLNWNPDEETWDCPCHGSRFTNSGELIDNPAQRGLKHE
jgi:glycine/D-amino acid oxidase-like deaminating enzyme